MSLRGLVLVRGEDFAALECDQLTLDDNAQAVLDKSDRSVAEQCVDPAGVKTE